MPLEIAPPPMPTAPGAGPRAPESPSRGSTSPAGQWRELLARFPLAASAGLAETVDAAVHLDKSYLDTTGFRRPMLLASPDQIGLTVPSPGLPLDELEKAIGSDRLVRAIDVATQRELPESWKLAQWMAYFATPPATRARVLNLISLECSGTRLGQFVRPPKLLRDIGWVERHWPTATKRDKMLIPRVQLYCLMSAGGSYTEFHIDFGGSSVWYHLYKGRKLFFVIPPTDANLARFASWETTYRHGTTGFFGNEVPECAIIDMREGDTILLPSGWIHAVYTPEDSISFGGNFLSSYHIPNHLRCHATERSQHVEGRFHFPMFEQVVWCAVGHYVKMLRSCPSALSKWELEGLDALIAAAKDWVAGITRSSVPDPDLMQRANGISRQFKFASPSLLLDWMADIGFKERTRREDTERVQLGNDALPNVSEQGTTNSTTAVGEVAKANDVLVGEPDIAPAGNVLSNLEVTLANNHSDAYEQGALTSENIPMLSAKLFSTGAHIKTNLEDANTTRTLQPWNGTLESEENRTDIALEESKSELGSPVNPPDNDHVGELVDVPAGKLIEPPLSESETRPDCPNTEATDSPATILTAPPHTVKKVVLKQNFDYQQPSDSLSPRQPRVRTHSSSSSSSDAGVNSDSSGSGLVDSSDGEGEGAGRGNPAKGDNGGNDDSDDSSSSSSGSSSSDSSSDSSDSSDCESDNEGNDDTNSKINEVEKGDAAAEVSVPLNPVVIPTDEKTEEPIINDLEESSPSDTDNSDPESAYPPLPPAPVDTIITPRLLVKHKELTISKKSKQEFIAAMRERKLAEQACGTRKKKRKNISVSTQQAQLDTLAPHIVLEKWTEDDEWDVDCMCGKGGKNYDDGLPMVQCGECNNWVHIGCLGYEPREDFVCFKCDWMFDCPCGISKKKYNDGLAMIECEKCRTWQHSTCVKIVGEFAPDDYRCPKCAKQKRTPRTPKTSAQRRRRSSNSGHKRRASKEADWSELPRPPPSPAPKEAPSLQTPANSPPPPPPPPPSTPPPPPSVSDDDCVTGRSTASRRRRARATIPKELTISQSGQDVVNGQTLLSSPADVTGIVRPPLPSTPKIVSNGGGSGQKRKPTSARDRLEKKLKKSRRSRL